MIHPRRVGHVVLNGHDLEKLERFYTEVLGFEVVARTKRPRGVFFSLGTQHHDLAVLQAPADAPAQRPAPTGLHHLALQVGSPEELKANYRELKARGVPIAATVNHRITHSVYFFDPEGNMIELFCDVGEDGLERIKRGEAAALDPLDLDA
ncbi:MAG: VOC family protein [Thermodesulfobacteriota bacterium]|jgi:catechol 2,3-dioxygenase